VQEGQQGSVLKKIRGLQQRAAVAPRRLESGVWLRRRRLAIIATVYLLGIFSRLTSQVRVFQGELLLDKLFFELGNYL
jgi:hypothetical protein